MFFCFCQIKMEYVIMTSKYHLIEDTHEYWSHSCCHQTPRHYHQSYCHPTAIFATAMLRQVKNIVFITSMLKCKCSTSQDSLLLVLSWAVIAKVILVSKKLFCVPLLYYYEIYFQLILYQKEVLLLWQNLLNLFLWQAMYFISLKYTYNNIESSAIVIGGFLDSTKL